MQHNKLSFEFDLKKSFKNYLNHGVSFGEPHIIWKDEHSIEFNDEEHSENESLYLKIAISIKVDAGELVDRKESVRVHSKSV